jgi:hypothetical protein
MTLNDFCFLLILSEWGWEEGVVGWEAREKLKIGWEDWVGWNYWGHLGEEV